MRTAEQRRFYLIQIILWTLLSAALFGMILMNGKWPGIVYVLISLALIALYGFRKEHSMRDFKGLLASCTAACVGISFLYFFGR